MLLTLTINTFVPWKQKSKISNVLIYELMNAVTKTPFWIHFDSPIWNPFQVVNFSAFVDCFPEWENSDKLHAKCSCWVSRSLSNSRRPQQFPISHLNAGFLLYADVSLYTDLTSVYEQEKLETEFDGQTKFYRSVIKMWFHTFNSERYI